VSVLEPAGSFNWVDVDWNGVRLTGKGRVEDRLEAEGKGFAVFSPEKLLVFDTVSGRRVYVTELTGARCHFARPGWMTC
jgi:hypothetical protein